MLSAIHLLLTYACTMKCDHCFLYCAPNAPGTFTLEGIQAIIDDATLMKSVTGIYFEGGEPFLYYPLLMEGIRIAAYRGFETGIVTNGYWGTSVADAKLWLKPLVDAGLSNLSISNDELHYGSMKVSPADHALAAAQELGLPASVLAKKRPEVSLPDPAMNLPDAGKNLADPAMNLSATDMSLSDADRGDKGRGLPEISGGIKFRGRAVERFAAGLPTRPSAHFTTCPFEDLRNPSRVHIDAYGHVHICQGLLIGNCQKTPLSELMQNYDPDAHPVCGPLLRGGPYQLLSEHKLGLDQSYLDACHCCYAARLNLLDTYPDLLSPRQVYGLP